MTGNVFHYTAKGTIASYEKTNDGYETLVREVLSGLNDTIDYTDYDSDGDGYIDALCLLFQAEAMLISGMAVRHPGGLPPCRI